MVRNLIYAGRSVFYEN